MGVWVIMDYIVVDFCGWICGVIYFEIIGRGTALVKGPPGLSVPGVCLSWI